MSEGQDTNPPMLPVILSMEVDDADSFESEYRLQIRNQVKYVTISLKPFDRDTLSLSIQSLPALSCNEEWTVQDLSTCETAFGKLYKLEVLHGDVNRYNFLVTKNGIMLLDFECLVENTKLRCNAHDV
ncbi:hypothetical protein BGZ63DRAFT_398999 [Mariannaea sp. PMI_226]|nr:hypothetical protein BGZ63DRAFT_398999 [Mariannaea sp. PMI_226]